ncbi:hypothetical protein [Pinibacter aurantiacus]|uniref:Uncharacterized protein n=1 Tax=Pinibacter aurantiacus TaxID=2851599 RepID=A0A9E2W797_9BACT|nr:hypothetical protein [Pinibacter aurantiacus]MBV4355862.1 hypothetical protein [Pinibacter aurantiacus]
MNNFFKHHIPNLEVEPNEHPLLPLHEHEHNTSEGSEFLDDAIRMHDQPLTGNVDAIAADAGENLF